MRTTERSQTTAAALLRPGRDLRHDSIRLASALAGPLVIVAAVLLALRGFAFRGMLTTQHPDLLSTFLPSWCFLGRNLGAGHVPAWNPHVMGGIPFAADPLSGWANVPVMVLFTGLPCTLAMRWFIVLQPIFGGLGVYWFLRTEGGSRVAATVGGSILALAVAGSAFALSLPFSGTLTWTALLLAAAARLMRARLWPGRLLWLAVTALAWGQLAATHLSDGLVPGSLALVMYLVAKATIQVRNRERTVQQIAVLAGLIVLAFPLINLAYFLPRLAYFPRTSIGQGYVSLQEQLARLRGVPFTGIPASGIDPVFPLRYTVPGGFYVGALGFVLAFVGWRERRLIHLAAAFSAYGAVSYVLALQWMTRHAQRFVSNNVLGSFYLHETQRFAFGLVLAVAVLAGVGVDAWRRPGPLWQRAIFLVPGLLVWGMIAPVLGVHRTLGWLPLAVIVAGILVLAASAYRPVWLALIAAIVLGELLVTAVSPASALGRTSSRPARGTTELGTYLHLNRASFFPASDYLHEGPIALALKQRDDGRYLSIAPTVWTPLGYHVRRTPPFWGLMGAQQSMLFGLEEGQGYNSIQLVRYWEFVRAVDPKRIKYNAAGFTRARPLALDLLQVRYLIQPIEDDPAVPGEVQIAQQGRWVLYQLPPSASPGRATVVPSWSVVSSSEAALTAVLDPSFRPAEQVVLEGRPALAPSPAPSPAASPGGTATYRATGLQSAVVHVEASAPSIVLVRNVYDPNWHATVDGRPVRVLPADYLVQGIPVPAGRHTISLTYDDPSIGYGMIGTALSLVILLGVAGFIRYRGNRAHAVPSPDGER